MSRDVFTTGDVARICRVAPKTAFKWVVSGLLEGYRLPGSRDWRVTRESLVRFLEENGIPLRWLDEFANENPKDCRVSLRSREAAKSLGISETTLWRWTKVGIIPHVRVSLGRREIVLYPLDELKAWLARQSQTRVNGKEPK